MAPAKHKPNIVVILADDLGFGDIGCYNPDCRIPTPHIDSLAARGVRWTDMHTPSAVCTPSRYGMLTGEYCWRETLSHGVLYGYEPPLIGAAQPTVASAMRGAGYRTSCVGKWHLGMEFQTEVPGSVDFTRTLPWAGVDVELESKIDLEAPIGGGPITRGFDTFFGTAGCATAQPPFAFIEQDRFVETPSEFREKIHFTGRPGMTSPGWDHAMADPTFTDRAVDQIRGFANDPRPFFLYLAASAPHEPCLEATVPEFARGRSGAGHRGDLVWLFDWMVGRVVETLRETGQAENTLIVVTSDNGALPGDRVNELDDINGYDLYDHLSCGEWRGYKSHIWEGGHRVPFVVGPAAVRPPSGHPGGRGGDGAGRHDSSDARKAGRREEADGSGSRAGRVETATACLTDLFATLPGIAGAPARGTDSLDLSGMAGFAEWRAGQAARQAAGGASGGAVASRGADALGVAALRGAASQRAALIHHSVFGVFSIRMDEWKLIVDSEGSGGWPPPRGAFPEPGSRGQLYNLSEDPHESVNLINDRNDIYEALADQLARYRDGAATVTR